MVKFFVCVSANLRLADGKCVWIDRTKKMKSWEYGNLKVVVALFYLFSAGTVTSPWTHAYIRTWTDQSFSTHMRADLHTHTHTHTHRVSSLSMHSRGFDGFQIPPLLLLSYSGHIHSRRIEGSESASSIIQKIHRGPQQGNEMDDFFPLFLCIHGTLHSNML